MSSHSRVADISLQKQNTFHHSPAQIQCVDFYRGESCVGFPKNLTDTLDPSHTLYTPIYNVGTFILDNLYFTPVTKYLDVETWELIDWGVACFNISSNQSCSTSYFPLNSATASGINTVTFSATIGLFPFGAGYWTVDLSMRFSCFDPLTLTSCGVIDFSSHLPPVYPTAASSPLVAIQDQDNHRIFVIVDYGSSSSRLNAVYGLCIDTNSLNVCDFPLSGPFEVSNGVSSFSSWVDQDSVFGPFFFYDTLGNVERLCYNSETGCYGCYDLRLYQTVNTEDSVSIRGIPFSLFFAQRNARVGSETLSGLLTSNQVGSRLYFSMFSNDGVGCWDFSLNGFCQTPSGVFGDVNEGFLSSNLDVQTRDYSTTYNPFDGCFYSIGDANVVWSFDSNGNTPCISLYPSTIQSTSMVVPVSGGNFSVDVLKNVSGIQSINYESLYIIDQSPGTGSFFVDPSFNGSIYFKASPNQCGYVNCTFGFCTLSFNPQNLTSTLSVHIFCPPKALNDTLECVAPLEAGHSTIINPLAKDNNPNNSSLVISILSYPSNASVMILPNGSFSITPEKGFQGYNTIEYQICDIFYQCSSAFVPFVVGPIVVANDDHIAIVNGEYGYVNASLNDQDIFGTLDLLTLSIIHPPDIGTAYSQLSLLGFITYFKDLTRTNYTTTLTYQICDSIDSSFNANRSLNHDTCQMDFFCAIANVTVIVQSFTYFPTLIPSSSHTAESTITASRTPSASISPPASQSHTNSISRSFSHTPSKSVSSSHSGTASVSLSSSSSPSISRAASPSPSASSVLISPSRSATQTHTPTFTTTSSGTASSSPLSPSPSSTPSFVLPQAPQPSNLPSVHPSRSGSQTPTISKSFSSSHSVSKSKSPSLSLSHRPSQSSSLTGSITETRTISVSKTSKPSTSATISSTASKSLSHSVSTSSTPSLGISPSGSRSPSTTISSTKSGTATQSAAASLSTSSSSRPSQTASTTISETTSNSAFITTSNSPSPSKVLQSLSPSQSPTLSLSQSPSRSLRPSESSSLAPTSTPSQSLTWSPSKPFLSQSSRITPEVTISPTTSPSPSSFLGIQVIASVSSSSTSIPCIP